MFLFPRGFRFNDDTPPDPPPAAFDPEKVEKTYKINNEELSFKDVFAQAQNKYKFDVAKMTQDEIVGVVNDFAFVANKQVANELFNRSKAEYDNKMREFENMKQEYDSKLQHAARLIEQIESNGTSKINEIDTKLKDTGLSVSEQVRLENEKIKIQEDIQKAKDKKVTDEFIQQQYLLQIERQKAELEINSQLQSIYTLFPNAKPSEDFGVIYKKISEGKQVSDEDQQRFIAIHDALNTYQNSSIPAANTFSVKWAKNFAGTNGNNGNANDDVHLTLAALVEKGLLNTDLNTALEQLKRNPPPTPGGQHQQQGTVTKSREERLAEAQF